ncbi:TonB-dependent receptor domain-containing protein [Lonepinella sp. MS14436]|uniref:TonB-dependent receptor domain-containing protein n=1 Tax=Lonepinella sp. MS14436 TaxID=3003619 RepID=UPI0036DAE749
MKKQTLLGLAVLATVPSVFATDLADPDQIKPLKEFSPPKPIAPNIAQGYMVENQFDRTDRSQYFSVANKVNEGVAPLKLSSVFYGSSFYNSIFSGFREANYYALFNINHTKANRYKDGQGNKVNFGYERFNQAAVLGWLPNDRTEFRLTFIHDDLDDDKQPEHQMDPVSTERYVVRLNGRFGQEDLSNTLSTELTYRHVKRHADNYSLRSVAGNNVYVLLHREVFDAAVKYDVDWSKFHNQIGVSYQHDDHDGDRYLHTAARDILNGYRFGNVHIDRYRVFDNLHYTFNEQHKLGLGLTYEYNRADVRKYNTNLPNPMIQGTQFANIQTLWKTYFGRNSSDGKIKQNALSAELKYEFTPTELQRYELSLGHLERVGDNMERFNSLASIVVRPNGTTMNQQPVSAIVDNPWVKPEEHNRIKFDFDLKNEFYKGYLNSMLDNGWNVGGSLVYDDVKNLIIFDRTRGQSGTIDSSGGIITRNVDAKLVIANLYANYNFLQNWAVGAKAFYNYGKNDTDDRPLYQIRPFELTANLDYRNYFQYGSYNLGTAVRYVAKQNKGDFDRTSGLGIDNRLAAKQFTVLDLYAGLNIQDKYAVRLGVNNVFNRQYAEFISGDHVLALTPNVVNASGRTYWLSLHASF